MIFSWLWVTINVLKRSTIPFACTLTAASSARSAIRWSKKGWGSDGSFSFTIPIELNPSPKPNLHYHNQWHINSSCRAWQIKHSRPWVMPSDPTPPLMSLQTHESHTTKTFYSLQKWINDYHYPSQKAVSSPRPALPSPIQQTSRIAVHPPWWQLRALTARGSFSNKTYLSDIHAWFPLDT